MIKNDQIWQIDQHVRFRRLFNEGVLIHQEQAEAIVLNDAAVTFLELCDGRRHAGEIIDGMATQFGVAHETLAKDLEPFINEMAKSGILRDSMAESL